MAEDNRIKELARFVPMEILPGRLNALEELRHKCNDYGVAIDKIMFYQNGVVVTLEGFKGNAVLHDGSYGRTGNRWETIDFPWDHTDVSVHSSWQLALLLCALKHGDDWERFDT